MEMNVIPVFPSSLRLLPPRVCTAPYTRRGLSFRTSALILLAHAKGKHLSVPADRAESVFRCSVAPFSVSAPPKRCRVTGVAGVARPAGLGLYGGGGKWTRPENGFIISLDYERHLQFIAGRGLSGRPDRGASACIGVRACVSRCLRVSVCGVEYTLNLLRTIFYASRSSLRFDSISALFQCRWIGSGRSRCRVCQGVSKVR